MLGQAGLVMSERFVQFSGLVDNCQYKQGEKETNIEELLEVERELQEVTKDFQTQTKEMEKVKTDHSFCTH